MLATLVAAVAAVLYPGKLGPFTTDCIIPLFAAVTWIGLCLFGACVTGPKCLEAAESAMPVNVLFPMLDVTS